MLALNWETAIKGNFDVESGVHPNSQKPPSVVGGFVKLGFCIFAHHGILLLEIQVSLCLVDSDIKGLDFFDSLH